jgi:CHAT domain-containing protein
LRGHLGLALKDAEKAYQRFSVNSPEWGWKFRLLQGEILIWRGLSHDALPLLRAEIPPGLATGDLQIKKSVLECLAYAALGNFPEADRSLRQAEQLSGATHTELMAEVRTARGILEVRQDRPNAAEQSFRQALQFARIHDQPFAEASALLNLSFAATHQRHLDEAVDWANRASQVAHTMDYGVLEEKALGNLGWSYYKMGDLERSLSFSLDAGRRAQDLGIVKDQIRWLYNAGGVYNARNQFALAEDCYRRALDLSTGIQDPEQITNALASLSSVSIQQQRFDLAGQYSQRAYDLAHSRGDRLAELYALLTKGQIALNGQHREEAEQLFFEVVKDPKAEASLLWQAQSELAKLYEQENKAGAANVEYQAALGTLECARGSIGVEEFRLSFLSNAAQIYDDYLRFLVEQGKANEALQAADYSRAQTLTEGLGFLPEGKNCASHLKLTFNLQQAARAASGTVLFYWLGPRQSYLWVVTATRPVLITLPPEAEIETLVQNYRKALLEPPDVLQTRNADGIKLYDTLVAPAQKLIPPGSRVTIIADSVLNNLNFETLLVSGAKPHYWIEDVTITNASSLRMLAASHATTRTGGKLLLIGDPVIPDPKFPPLPSAKIEMEDIEKHFPADQRQVFSGSTASPAAFLNSKPGTFSYVHFVAHGTASQLSPLDSAVILSKATAEEDSYKLHARDIVAHPFRANLVVVSTCYGSGTTLYNGEGLVGLSWAFLRAGAHDVIGALWQVSDSSTPQLMDQLYGELRKGRSPQDALRAAKLSLLHSDGPFRKPFYWAPFQLYTGS